MAANEEKEKLKQAAKNAGFPPIGEPPVPFPLQRAVFANPLKQGVHGESETGTYYYFLNTHILIKKKMYKTGRKQSNMARISIRMLLSLEESYPGFLGDRTSLSRINGIFDAFLAGSNNTIPTMAECLHKKDEMPIEYKVDDALWLGKWKVQDFPKKKFGLSQWRELKLVMAMDGFVLLPSDRLGLVPKGDPKLRHNSDFDVITINDVQVTMSSILDFISNWFSPQKPRTVVCFSSLSQRVDIESFCPEQGVLLTINFEVGMPQKDIPDEWFEVLK